MRRIFEIFLSLSILLYAAPASAQADETIRIVVYGDSLTSGYQLDAESAFPAKLDRKLRAVGFNNVEVVNMSVAGATTADGVENLRSLLAKQPDIVVLELGANDALRGIKTDFIYGNLVKITSALVSNSTYVVLVGMKAPVNMGYSYGQQLEAVYSQIAKAYKLSLYPFALDGIFGNQDMNLADGYHPNAKGVDLMVDRMYPMIDAGVRWKWKVMQYEQQLQHQNDMAPQIPAPAPY